MKHINTVFLDLDGVIKDWCSGIFELFDIDPIDVVGYHDIDNYVKKFHGISNTYFWEKQDKDFWLGLDFFPWADALIDMLPYDKVCLLTKPTKNNAGWAQEWIRINMPEFFRDDKYLIGPGKHYCADGNALLIDDSDTNVINFRKFGGKAILFPQSWNHNRTVLDSSTTRVEWIKVQLSYFNI